MIDYENERIETTDFNLANLTKLVQRQKEIQHEVNNLEKQLADAKVRLNRVELGEIPSFMGAAGLSEITLSDGTVVTVKETLYASIPKDKKHQAIEWLEHNGAADLISCDVVVSFDKESFDEAIQFADQARDEGYTAKVDQSVNTGNVKSLIKERLQEGKEMPLELFGAYFMKRSVLS